MISVEGALTVYEKCLSAGVQPDLRALIRRVCQINRNPVTGTATTDDRLVRQRGVRGSVGVDVTADWRTDLAGGHSA